MATLRTAPSCPGCSLRIFNATLEAYMTKASPSRTTRMSRRQFTASSYRARGAGAIGYSVKPPAQPSMKVAMRAEQMKAMKAGKMIPDGGLAPLPPSLAVANVSNMIANSNLSYLQRLKAAPWIYWYIYWTKLQFLFTNVWALYNWPKPRPKYDRMKIGAITINLYEKIFKAFADGNLEDQKPLMSEGLYASLEQRIARRRPGECIDWKIVKGSAISKVISFRFSPLPADMTGRTLSETSGLFQAIVQLRTKQSMQKMMRSTARVGGKVSIKMEPLDKEPVIKQTVEYAVLNQIIRDRVQGPWMLWGFTKELTLDAIDEDRRKKEHIARGALRSRGTA